MKRLAVRPITVLLVFLPALVFSGCEFVDRFRAGTLEEQLVDAAVDRWATRGQPFFDGASGRDTVASVSATGARAWEVGVLPLSGGAPVVWSFEVMRADVYPLVTGDPFAQWIGEQARILGMRTFLPDEVVHAIRQGGILAVGDLEVRYGSADRTGRNTEERVAYLVPGADGGRPRWEVQQVSRSANVLLLALKTVVQDMVYRDDRVMSCMGSGTPSGVPKSEQLACVAKVWAHDFEVK